MENVICIYTGSPMHEIRKDGGSGCWKLDSKRFDDLEYILLIKKHNNNSIENKYFSDGQAFLLGKVSGYRLCKDDERKKVVEISEYTFLESNPYFKRAREILMNNQRCSRKYSSSDELKDLIGLDVTDITWTELEVESENYVTEEKVEEHIKDYMDDEQTEELLPYTIDNIINDGCFLPRERIEKIINRLSAKKNIILQGPPGTGKTWLAKKLAFVLVGQRDDSKVRTVQFHPNLSYEDFIRGWRPSGEGKLTLVDGPFMDMIRTANNNPESKYVVVIEEINRGNPAQVFGEMLTLLETDKRALEHALELSYKKTDSERIFIPENLYVIGTMNVADRSLALVDLALRRRFAFIDLKPVLGQPWHDWMGKHHNIDADFLTDIENRMHSLNSDISSDSRLGTQFQIGHSYVTPATSMTISDTKSWFCDVVETEIVPLLDEYWFDDLEKSQDMQQRLIQGL